MRIYYHTSAYISHRLAGLAYIECLERLGHTVLRDPADLHNADMAILHDDPLIFPQLFERHPELYHLRTVGYCVWENELLTPFYVQPLQLVAEVWTASSFSQKSLSSCHKRVSVLPHVVHRTMPGKEDMQKVESLVQGASHTPPGKAFRFFSIMDAINPRKNLGGLLAAFTAVRTAVKPSPVLIIKQYRVNFDLSGIEGVISFDDELSAKEIAALHVLSGAYVSAHHCEGWGLGLSEAMAFGKPVIATAYSGNMEYMRSDNSLPVPYTMEAVSDEMVERIPLFTKDMQWARPDVAAMSAAMKRAAEGRLPANLAANASKISRDFGMDAISDRIQLLVQG